MLKCYHKQNVVKHEIQEECITSAIVGDSIIKDMKE